MSIKSLHNSASPTPHPPKSPPYLEYQSKPSKYGHKFHGVTSSDADVLTGVQNGSGTRCGFLSETTVKNILH